MASIDHGGTQALEAWESDRPLEAGRIIFGRFSNDDRPQWAANVLQKVLQRMTVTSPLVETALHVASDKAAWHRGHAVSSEIGRTLLDLEKVKCPSKEQILLINILWLAVIVARVSYNSTVPSDPFDDETGYCVASILKSILNLVDDREFSKRMWTEISGR